MQWSRAAMLIAGAAALAVSCADGAAQAQQPASAIIPGITVALGRDDNMFFSDANRQSSSIRVVSPFLRLEGAPGAHKYDLTLRADDGHYGSDQADDYVDYGLAGNADLSFSARSGLRARLELRHGHDPRGSTDRPFGIRPDEYNHMGGEGVLRYGAAGARGRIELDGGYFRRRYTNNREITAANDYDQGTGGATFLWRVQPRTQLLMQAQRRAYNYVLPASTLDSTETRLYGGARWQATAKTDGSAKIGRLKKEFRDSTREDVVSGSWDIGIRWSPLTYSAVDFLTSKQTTESTGLGDTIITKLHAVSWTHDWNSRVRSQLVGSWRGDVYQGATREDQTRSLGVNLSYQFRRWLRFGAEATRALRDSSADNFDYHRNVIFFNVTVSL